MFLNDFFKKRRLISKAHALRRNCENTKTVEELANCVMAEKKFSLVQKKREIAAFLTLVKDLKPTTIVDIGSSGGGTIRLFSHLADPKARYLSLDIANTKLRQAVFPHLIRPGQTIDVLEASSYDPVTVEYVKNWLKRSQIDLLFIDGDHEYKGVSSDFRLYAPFVRKGGLIGLHDIVPDYKTRYGKPTPAYVGDVPKFWHELKFEYNYTQEFIEDPQQDGYGIGVVWWKKER